VANIAKNGRFFVKRYAELIPIVVSFCKIALPIFQSDENQLFGRYFYCFYVIKVVFGALHLFTITDHYLFINNTVLCTLRFSRGVSLKVGLSVAIFGLLHGQRISTAIPNAIFHTNTKNTRPRVFS
jgi:hypothetical protein